jgi:hypothetical protein
MNQINYRGSSAQRRCALTKSFSERYANDENNLNEDF